MPATNIADGDSTPSTTDGTDFGSAVVGGAVSRTFTIANDGTANLLLDGTPVVAVSGSPDFTVTGQPTSPVTPAGSTMFTVTYTPSGVGADSGSVSIANNDADEDPFNFAIAGTGAAAPAPEIAVSGGTPPVDITDGDSSPSPSDGTDFGMVTVGDTATSTFTIANDGTGDLVLDGVPPVVITGSTQFAVTQQPTSPVGPSDSTTFTIVYTAADSGTDTATVSIANNDADEDPFDFTISANAADAPAPEIAVSGGALAVDITDGDSDPSLTDGTDFGPVLTDSDSSSSTFTIDNDGTGDLLLDGTPPVTITGPDATDFDVTLQPGSPVAPTESTTFTVTYTPTDFGPSAATVSIANNDADEDPFDFAIAGNGAADLDCTVADGPDCLRRAIQAANDLPGAQTITLGAGGYTLGTAAAGRGENANATGDYDILGDLTITGADDATVTIDAAGNDRIFDVIGPITVSISGVTLTGGSAPTEIVGGDLENRGGALRVAGGATFTLAAATIDGNTAGLAGGGLENNRSSVTLTGTTFSDNTATTANGGAVHVTDPAAALAGVSTTLVQGGTFSGNTAGAEGGALWNDAGDMTVNGVLISGNTAAGNAGPGVDQQGGGGVFNVNGDLRLGSGTDVADNDATGTIGSGGGILSTGGEVRLALTDVTGNSAVRAGGGIEVVGTLLAMNNASTLSDNTAGPNPGNGGALHVTGAGSNVMIGNTGVVTVSGNTAAREGGGLWNDAGSTMAIRNAVITDNTASGPAADDGGGGVFNNGGTTTLDGADVSGNRATGALGSGGGLLSTAGSVTIDGSTINGNVANRAGGGLEVINGTLAVTESLLQANNTGVLTPPAMSPVNGIPYLPATAAAPGNGGGLHVSGTAGTVSTFTGAIVEENIAANEGGGLWNQWGSTLEVRTQSFLGGNRALGTANADDGGGAIFQNATPTGSALPTLRVASSTIDGNTARSGGGILSSSGQVVLTGSTIRNNSATRAGGGIEVVTGDVDVTATQFTANATGPAPGNGGAIHITGAGTIDVMGGSAVNNTASSEGGGFWNSGPGAMTVTSTQFTNNSAAGALLGQGGGALFNDGGTLTVANARFTGNDATGAAPGGSGGGILNDARADDDTVTPNIEGGQGRTIVSGSIFTGNTSVRAGGAIEGFDGANDTVNVSVATTTFTGNTATVNGGAIHLTGAGNSSITGGIAADNVAGQEGGAFWNDKGTMTVTGVTLTSNDANGMVASQGGGALFNNGGTLRVSGSTITNNTTTPPGTGGAILCDGGTLDLTSTPPNTITGNTRPQVVGINGCTVIADPTLEPEIAVSGGTPATDISDGDTSPSLADGTDFGTVILGITDTSTSTFTISNSGPAGLLLDGTPAVAISGPDAADFTVTTAPATTVAPGGSTTFTITYGPSDAGVSSATVSIANNDFDEDPFDFAIQGTALLNQVVVNGMTGDDATGDGSEANPYATIQRGVDVATDGFTILVRPAIYDELVDIVGEDLEIVADDGAILRPSTPQVGPNDYVLDVADGADVAIINLDVDGVDQTNNQARGVRFLNSDGSLSDLDVVNFLRDYGVQGGLAVVVNGTSAPVDVTLDGVTIEDWNKQAVTAVGEGALAITDSEIVGQGAGTGQQSQNGVVVFDEIVATITGTDFSAFGPSGGPTRLTATDGTIGYAIFLGDADVGYTVDRTGTTISGNTFTDVQGLYLDLEVYQPAVDRPAGLITNQAFLAANPAVDADWIAFGPLDEGAEIYGNLSDLDTAGGSDSMVQYALDSSSFLADFSDPEIVVGPGTYAVASLDIADEVVLLTTDDAALEGTARVTSPVAATIRGFTITGFVTDPDGTVAGVYVPAGGQAVVQGATITGTGSAGERGVIVQDGFAGVADVSDSTISDVASGVYYGTLTSGSVTGTSFSDVVSGVAAVTEGAVAIDDSSFSGATDEGVGIGGANVTITDSAFADNAAHVRDYTAGQVADLEGIRDDDGNTFSPPDPIILFEAGGTRAIVDAGTPRS